MSAKATDDFASAAMMRLVAAGLARQGITFDHHAPGGAHVPRRDKQAALAAIRAAHGRLAVMRIADALPTMPLEPVLMALTRARDVPDLLARWHRLETFSHGRHRVRVEHAGSCEVRMTHGARDGGPEPSEPETTLVLSVLARFAEIVQAAPVALVDPAGRPWRKDGMWHDPGRVQPGGNLQLHYSGNPVREPPPAMNPANAMVADLRKRIAADPMRRWSLAEISGDVGLSSRSLQRRLAQQGLSLSRLVRETRLQAAAALLVEETGPGLAEIGFLAGYADQAHFTRSFAEGVGTSPRRYRKAFSNPVPSHSCS